MSASQFEKITDYGQFEHLGGGVADNDLLPWRHCHSTPTPQGYGVGGEDQEECVIANICPLSPLSNGGAPTTSSDDQPDTPGMTRAQSFDLVVFDVRKVPPELIAVSGVGGWVGGGCRGDQEGVCLGKVCAVRMVVWWWCVSWRGVCPEKDVSCVKVCDLGKLSCVK